MLVLQEQAVYVVDAVERKPAEKPWGWGRNYCTPLNHYCTTLYHGTTLLYHFTFLHYI